MEATMLEIITHANSSIPSANQAMSQKPRVFAVIKKKLIHQSTPSERSETRLCANDRGISAKNQTRMRAIWRKQRTI
jgi:hypothetical protein